MLFVSFRTSIQAFAPTYEQLKYDLPGFPVTGEVVGFGIGVDPNTAKKIDTKNS